MPRTIVKISQLLTYLILKAPFRLEGHRLSSIKTPVSNTIIASNHVSYRDFLAIPGSLSLGAMIRSQPMYFMTANQFLRPSLTGIFLRLNGGFKAYPHKDEVTGVQRSIDILKRSALVIFPEGGLPVDGKPREPKRGIVDIVSKTNAMVLPIYIDRGTDNGRYRLKVIHGEVFNARGMSAEEIMAVIYQLNR